jgi:hypothetical protein
MSKLSNEAVGRATVKTLAGRKSPALKSRERGTFTLLVRQPLNGTVETVP